MLMAWHILLRHFVIVNLPGIVDSYQYITHMVFTLIFSKTHLYSNDPLSKIH